MVLVWLLGAGAAHAQTSILTLLSNETEPYMRFQRQLDNDLNDPGQSTRLTTKIIGKRRQHIQSTTPYDVCLSVGIAAAEYLSLSNHDCRQIHAFVPRILYQRKRDTREIRCPESSCLALVIDQPLNRQVDLIKLALPQTRRLAVVLSSYSDRLEPSLRAQARDRAIELTTTLLQDSDDIVPAVSRVIEDAQALLALPDPVVFNRYTARSILLSTYRAGIPVIAYSAAYVRAGALLGLYSTPEQIARHAAEIILNSLSAPSPGDGLVYPKYFTLNNNDAVAQSLNIELPPLNTLKSRLQGDDRE